MAQVRVSVANIATFARRVGERSSAFFGILNPKKLAAGEYVYQALGGGAQLTDAGVDELEKRFGAHSFEHDKETGRPDARFLVEEGQVEGVLAFFRETSGKPDGFEEDPLADIVAELTGKEFPLDYGTILSSDDLTKTRFESVDTVRQAVAEDGVGTSERAADAKAPTRRLFRRYRLVMPGDIFDRMMRLPMVRLFGPNELASTHGGAKKGVTADGKGVIADNLFP